MKIILVNPGLNVNLATYEPQGRPIRSRFLGRFQISIYLNFGKMTLVSFCLKTRDVQGPNLQTVEFEQIVTLINNSMGLQVRTYLN